MLGKLIYFENELANRSLALLMEFLGLPPFWHFCCAILSTRGEWAEVNLCWLGFALGALEESLQGLGKLIYFLNELPNHWFALFAHTNNQTNTQKTKKKKKQTNK